MGNDYMMYPDTVKKLAGELKAACNDYQAKKIDNSRIKAIIQWYAENQADKFFKDGQINPTVAKIIGQRRVRLIWDLLKAETGGI